MSNEIIVFADWEGLEQPTLVGTLRTSVIRGKEHFIFAYDGAIVIRVIKAVTTG